MRQQRTRVPALGVVLLVAIGAYGCQREPAAPQPTTAAEPDAAATSEGQRFLTNHDEPIVVDNGPIQIVLGSAGKVTENASTLVWSRDFEAFGYMVVLPRKDNG